MPSPDKYGTQSAIALLRQQTDYGGFYDLKKLTMKEIRGVQYLAAMNPTAGSFFIIDRMQRHFCTLGTPFPEAEVLGHVYKNIMGGHTEIFNESVRDAIPNLINCAVAIHQQVADELGVEISAHIEIVVVGLRDHLQPRRMSGPPSSANRL